MTYEEHPLAEEQLRLIVKETEASIRAEAPASSEERMMRIRQIRNEEVRTRVARSIYGPKLAGDLGLVSTQNHPKTDYGNPSFTGAYDIDDK